MLLRKYWFYTLTLLHTLFDLGILIYDITLWVAWAHQSPEVTDSDSDASISGGWIIVYVCQDLFLGLGILNGIYLSTHGYLRTNTILGSFALQQIVTAVLIGLALAALIGRHDLNRLEDDYTIPWEDKEFILYFVGSTLYVLSSSALWCLFFISRRTKDNLLGHWTVDIGDLATGIPVPLDGISWRGTKRPDINEKSYRRRTIKPVGTFIFNAFFRRVPEVETMIYALFQHSFALAAIGLLIARAATLLTQLGNENLPSRTVVDVCPAESRGYYLGVPESVMVLYPELAGVNNTLNPESVNLRHSVSIEYEWLQWTIPNGSVITDLKPCTSTRLQKVDSNSNGEMDTMGIDWFYVFNCTHDRYMSTRWKNPTGFIKYAISSRSQINTSDKNIVYEHLPSLWLVSDRLRNYTLTPYAVPPIRPVFQTSAYFDTRLALRKYISSSPFRDAVIGSKPKYNTLDLYLWSQMHSQQMPPSDGANTVPHTTGYIRLPGFVNSAPQTPGSMLKEGVRGPEDLCEIIEEYRNGSTFDILASIGGLLALLQGLHIFLFGRPLFWGLFGAKIITPFGILGRLTTKGFRGRLKNRYDPDSLSNQERKAIKQETILMTRFLLDYVVDLGPAEWRADTQKPEQEGLLGESSNTLLAAVQGLQGREERQEP